MRSVVSLISGAGPGISLGGLALMRRPALLHPNHADLSAWARPYPTGLFSPVFYNGDPATPPAAPAPTPTPADLAARAAQQAPAQPPATPGAPAPLIDHDTGLAMTQDRFTKIMTRENTKGRKALLRELAESSGLELDVDNFDVSQFGQILKKAETARQAQLSEEQRRAEDLAEKERALEARVAAAEAREAAAALRDKESKVRAVLVGLGATGADLDDATALLRVADDADDAAITEAAGKLKERRAELFGGTAAPQTTLPPAPGGAPAGGPPPRTPAGGKDAVREAARKRAESMGLRKPEAA